MTRTTKKNFIFLRKFSEKKINFFCIKREYKGLSFVCSTAFTQKSPFSFFLNNFIFKIILGLKKEQKNLQLSI